MDRRSGRVRKGWEDAATHLTQAESLAELIGTVESVATTQIAAAALAFARFEPRAVIDRLAARSDAEAAGRTSVLTLLDWWPMLVIALVNEADVAGAERERERLLGAVDRRRLGGAKNGARPTCRTSAAEPLGRDFGTVSTCCVARHV